MNIFKLLFFFFCMNRQQTCRPEKHSNEDYVLQKLKCNIHCYYTLSSTEKHKMTRKCSVRIACVNAVKAKHVTIKQFR